MVTIDFEYSVVIPVYNDFDRLERAVKSVIDQIVKPTSIIIVDDASDTDFNSVQELIPITYIKLGKNSGSFVARKIGIQYTTTEYIFFLDSDDSWNRDHAKIHSDIWMKNGARKVAMVGTLLAPEAETSLTRAFSKKNGRLMDRGEREIGIVELLADNPFYNSASSFSKKGLDDVLLANDMDEGMQYCEDLNLLCEFLARKCELILTPSISGKYNLSGNRKSDHHSEVYMAVLKIGKRIARNVKPNQRRYSLSIYLGLINYSARWIYGVQNESIDFSSYREKFPGLDPQTSRRPIICHFNNRFCFYFIRLLVWTRKYLTPKQ